MLVVTRVGCPGEMGHNQLLLCSADSSPPSGTHLDEAQTVNIGVSGWEVLSLRSTLLDLSALFVANPSVDRTDVMKSYNQSEQS